MPQNQGHQGLMVEDQALGMMGFFSTNPNSNSLASFLPRRDYPYDSSAHATQQSLKYSSIRGVDVGDADVEDDHQHQHLHGASSNNSSSICEALLFSCANTNPKPRDLLHQDPSSFTAAPNSSNPWEWGSGAREPMESKRMFDGDNQSLEEDYNDAYINHQNNNINKNYKVNNALGVSTLRMKKMKGVRRKVREPRFSFKTLSDVDILDDGYKWRKYGQKVVKNTHHPRSYYRCTQEKCRVKKRVERLAEDPRMVITTYEGRHAHSPYLEEDDSFNYNSNSNSAHPLLTNFFC